MNKIWKYLFILAIVLLISMGGVYASDNNQSSDDVMGVTMDDADDLAAVDTSVADEDMVVDVDESPTADENLTKDLVVTDSTDSSDFKASSLEASSGSDGVLGASAESDVLTASFDHDNLGANANGGNFKNLRDLVSANNILTFYGDYTSRDADYIGDLIFSVAVPRTGIEINKNFVFEGQGVMRTIDAGDRSRIFNINGAYTVTFRNLYFKNGQTQSNIAGGAIYITAGATVTFENCQFGYCSSPNGAGGGAIAAAANCAQITIKDCYFFDNSAQGFGGAISYATGTSKLNITNTRFEHNFVTTGASTFGGAIAYDGNLNANSYFYLNNCNFTNQNSRGSGSVMQVQGTNSGKCQILNCRFESNTANTYSTADFSQTDGLIVDNCIFKDNSVTGSAVGNAKAGGAGLYIKNCNGVRITDSEFTGNTVTGAFDGGAIYAYDNTVITEIGNCYFKSNVAQNGGALYVDTGSNGINVIGSTFTSNQARASGGAVYANDLNVRGSSFDNNAAVNGGGAIYCQADDAEIHSSNFTNNRATSNQDGYGGAVYIIGDDAIVDTSRFDDNTANVYGGALAVRGTGGDIAYCEFNRNSAQQSGGAIYIDGGATVRDSEFTANTGNTYGGAIYWKGSGANIIRSNFTSNQINNNLGGGAICIQGDSGSIDYSNFIDNSALSAGAIYLLGSGNVISNSVFTANHVSMYGGAVYLQGSGNEVLTSTFTDNSAGPMGGAIYIDGSNSKIVTDTFINNAASANGNAIWVESGSSNTISKSNFTGTKQIYVNAGSTTLRENTETSNIDNEYMVYNKATLSLYDNEFNNVIYNTGIINTQTYANVTNNKTYENWTEWSFPTFAHVYDDNDNTIVSVAFTYRGYVNSVEKCNSTASDDIWHNGTLSVKMFNYLVSADDTGLTSLTVHTSLIKMAIKLGSYTWLQDQIDKLNGNVLVMTQNVTFNETYDLHANNPYVQNRVNFTNGMRYNKTFTLNGNGNYISGDDGARIFTVMATGVRINNVNFINGYTAENGGAILINPSNVYFNNCNFTNNTAAKSGGAIYYNPETSFLHGVSIEDCIFENNAVFADKLGSGTDGCGGAVFLGGSNNVLADNTFAYNKAHGENANGGAVFFAGKDVTVTNNIFNSNYAKFYGGAVAATSGTENIQVIDSTFYNNTAINAGGLDFWQTEDAKVINCLFDNNVASNKAGALYMNGENGVVSYCNFTNNKADYSSAISYTPQDVEKVGATKANITYCNFENNTAYVTGTVRFDSSQGNIKFCNFTNNVAGSAAGIYVYINDVTIEQCRFNNNDATSGNGGAIFADYNPSINYNNTSIIYCVFTDNHASGNGGAVYMMTKDNIISNSNFTNNRADGNGGAVYTTNTNQKIIYSNFIKNNALDGGAVYLSGQNSIISYSNFINNTAARNGGAVLLANSNQKILGSLFDGNNATKDGGSVYVSGTSGMQIEDSTFKNSNAYNGGALYHSGGSTNSLKLLNDTFIKNIASHNGGAVYYIYNIANPQIYRDYNNFDGVGIIDGTTHRTSVTMVDGSVSFANAIERCLFEDNRDMMNPFLLDLAL